MSPTSEGDVGRLRVFRLQSTAFEPCEASLCLVTRLLALGLDEIERGQKPQLVHAADALATLAQILRVQIGDQIEVEAIGRVVGGFFRLAPRADAAPALRAGRAVRLRLPRRDVKRVDPFEVTAARSWR